MYGIAICANGVKREMALISVAATSKNRTEIIQTIDIFNAKIINAGKDSYIIEVTGNEQKTDALIGERNRGRRDSISK